MIGPCKGAKVRDAASLPGSILSLDEVDVALLAAAAVVAAAAADAAAGVDPR